MVLAGGTTIVIAGLSLAGTMTFIGVTPLGLFLPGMLQTLGQGLSLPNSQTGALSIDRHLAGTAAGIAVFLQLFLGAALSMLVGALVDGTIGRVIAVITGAAALSFAAGTVPILVGLRDRRRASA
jgi:DHA1 family bicyclomycin/chloramphenicol resistance-like MFS transporter